MIDLDSIPLDDAKTFETIFKPGKCIGVFQLEKPLGRMYSRKLKPETIDHVAALTAILRPGCLAAKDDDGVNMTDKFCLRKNGEQEAIPYHPSLKAILEETYQLVVYQESAIRISRELAGFNAAEADNLRSAIGKKDTQKMSEVAKLFIDRAEAVGIVTREQATQIMNWLIESARYSFNKSHSFGYGMESYTTAYLKANYPVEFFWSWLKNSDNIEDVELFCNDAKRFDIKIVPPDITNPSENFEIIDDTTIQFGLISINGVGEAVVKRILEVLSNKVLKKCGWVEILSTCVGPSSVGKRITPSVAIKLIKSGAFRKVCPDRNKMLFEVEQFCELTDTQLKWMNENHNFETVADMIEAASVLKKDGGGSSNANSSSRAKCIARMLRNPPFELRDTVDNIVDYETETLGVALTCNRLDRFNTAEPTHSLREFLDGNVNNDLIIDVEIIEYREYTISRGRSAGCKMAFISLKDETAQCDESVAFTEAYLQMTEDDLLYEGAKLIIQCKRDPKKGSLQIERAKRLA